MARALIVVPPESFSCGQYRQMRQVLTEHGFEVQVASRGREEIKQPRCSVTPDVSLDQVHGGSYDVLVFVAGRGNRRLLEAPEAHRLAREAVSAGRVVGASGLAVGILANAGVLRGQPAAGPISLAGLLQERGAIYTADPVAVAANVVTLRKSEAFPIFAQQLLELVLHKAPAGKAA